MARSRRRRGRAKSARRSRSVTRSRRCYSSRPRSRKRGGATKRGFGRFIPGGSGLMNIGVTAAGIVGGYTLGAFILNRVPGNLQNTPMKRLATGAALAAGTYIVGKKVLPHKVATLAAAGVFTGSLLGFLQGQISRVTAAPGMPGMAGFEYDQLSGGGNYAALAGLPDYSDDDGSGMQGYVANGSYGYGGYNSEPAW